MKKLREIVEAYDREKHKKKLDKTSQSLRNHLARTKSHDTRRTWHLVQRYEDLRNHMRDHDHDGWKEYNKERGFDPSHDGHDLLA